MSSKRLRVFHGPLNYGSQAGILALGLRELGIQAKAYTNADNYLRQTDYHFKQRKGLFAKLYFYKFWYPLVRLSCFFKFNIFHFYFGKTLTKKQWDLPLYRIFGKKVIMHYLGNDVELYNWSVENYRITQMSQIFNKESGAKHDTHIVKRREYEDKYLDYTMVCAPQYSPFVDKAKLVPLAIDTSKYSYHALPERDGPLRIVHAPSNPKKKGTGFLMKAVEKLQSEGYDIELDICQGITHEELIQRYINAHLSVVALLGGWYGAAGIEAMALGRPIVSFIRPELLKYTEFQSEEEIPVINANISTIYCVLKNILDSDMELLKQLGIRSYDFVRKHHDLSNVSKQLKSIYESL